MVWDLDTPADNDKIRVVDDYIREMKRDIEYALQEEHSFPVNSASPVCYHKIPEGNTAARPEAGNEGRWYFNTQTGTIQRDNGEEWENITEPDPFPSGSDCLFRQNAAPTGWTRLNENNALYVRIVSGVGGGTGGAYAPSTTSENFSHSHTIYSASINGASTYGDVNVSGSGANVVDKLSFSWTSNVHNHTVSNDNMTHSHGENIFSPRYSTTILARKN